MTDPPSQKVEEPPKTVAAKPDKPSSMKPLELPEARSTPVVTTPTLRSTPAVARAPGKAQDVFIPTNPAGATVTLDGNGASCSTPCTLSASPGLHSISIRFEGYQEERREIHIGAEQEDIPLISLRRASGTLWLTSVPAGATITINDKVQSQRTPAQINLPPAVYTVTVEKDGRRQVDRVEITNGNTNFVKVMLE